MKMDADLDYERPLPLQERPLTTNNTLLLIPGPTNISPRVLRALSNSTVQAYMNDELFKITDNVRRMVQYVLQTKSPYTMIHEVSGNGGNDVMIANLTEPGETVIIVDGGMWGGRLVTIAKRHRVNVVVMKTEKIGQVFTNKEFEEKIKEHKPSALFLVHGDTVSGYLQPLEGLADICHKYNCLLGVDGVITAAANPIFFDRWKLDAITAAGQKSIGATCGISMLAFSEAAKIKMFSKKSSPPFFLDAICIGNNFDCYGEGRSFMYSFNSHTYCGLHEALAEICEEGLKNSWERHKKCGEMLCKGLEKLGFTLPISKELRLIQVIIAKPPNGIKVPALIEHLREKYKVAIGYGIGVTQRHLRIGLLGYNAKPQVVEYFLKVLEEAMEYVRVYKADGPDDYVVKRY